MKKFLETQKKIFDSIHGFIFFDEEEREVVDSMPFQRLRHIRQTGMAFLAYPGATHSRFEHSLGVMLIASQIFERITNTMRPDVLETVPRKESLEYRYWLKILRLASLCHDVGHLPFSHVAEADILQNGHEEWTLKIIESRFLEPVWESVSERFTLLSRNVKEDVIKIALGQKELKRLRPNIQFTQWEKIVSDIIAGDFFGADRIDYLLRDARYTGIVYGLFDYHQLIEQLCIIPNPKTHEMEIGIDEKGIESSEALLLARHFMFRRVYQYHIIKSFNFHLKRFMKRFFVGRKDILDVENYVFFNDITILSALMEAARKGDADARIFFDRAEHFKAILLPDKIRPEHLEEFKKKNNLSDQDISWDFVNVKDEKDLSFLVSTRHLKVQPIGECSPILAHLPSENRNWVYIAPQFEMLLLHALD